MTDVITPHQKPYRFYDEGWNARIRGEPFRSAIIASPDWRDGWKDCDELDDAERARIGEME